MPGERRTAVVDPISAPLCTALVLTASSVFGAGPGNAQAALAALAGNLAAGSIDMTTRRLLARLADVSIDRSTGLPRNHDLQRTSADALRGTALALILEVAGQLEPRKPWVPAIAGFIRDGRFGRAPLLETFKRADLEWLACLEPIVRSERFVKWHDGLTLTQTDLLACFEPRGLGLTGVLSARFKEWALRTAGEDHAPQAFFTALEQGWATGTDNKMLLHFGEVYSLFFREFLKCRPEAFRAFTGYQLAGTNEAVRDLAARAERTNELLQASVGQSAELFADSASTMELLRGGQKELVNQQLSLLCALTALKTESCRGNQEAVTAMQLVREHVEQVSSAFGGLEGKLFGLPLIRPSVPVPPRAGGDLWLLQAKFRALDLVGREAELQSLWNWLESPDLISVRLVTGPSGAG